jgi:hypothetical protein
MSQPVKLLINDWHQLVARDLIAFAPGDEQLRHFMW